MSPEPLGLSPEPLALGPCRMARMVRREEASRRGPAFRCPAPAGASPASVSPGAPSSRPQAYGESHAAQAGRQEPLRRKPARGPQHHVKPAASTHSQSESRAGHVAVKATSRAPQSGGVRARGLGGVWGVARVQGTGRNTRGPSAPLGSEQVRSYKPTAKARHAQRASEGVVVPRIVATNNATGGKDPCGGQANGEGTCEGMAGRSGPNSPGGHPPIDKVQPPSTLPMGRGHAVPGSALSRPAGPDLEG